MMKKLKDFMLITITTLIMVFGVFGSDINLKKREDKETTEINTQEIIDDIKNNYTHRVDVLTRYKGEQKCYFAYWSVPKVTVHLDGTETTKDMIQVHRYNSDGEYIGMVVAYSLEDAIKIFDNNF